LGFDGTGAKFSFWGGRCIRRAGFGVAFFDRASVKDRGLNVRSTVLYLRWAHDAEVSYLAAAESGARGPGGQDQTGRWDPHGRSKRRPYAETAAAETGGRGELRGGLDLPAPWVGRRWAQIGRRCPLPTRWVGPFGYAQGGQAQTGAASGAPTGRRRWRRRADADGRTQTGGRRRAVCGVGG
jgi:hypothetical protein